MNLLTISTFSDTCSLTCASVISSRLCCFYEVENGRKREIANLILGGDIPDIIPSTANGTGNAYYSFSLKAITDPRQ